MLEPLQQIKNPLTAKEYLTRRVANDYSPRTDYFRDQTAIIHSMPFRRLKQKTQVFFSPQNDHVCTRIEHVLHVASIAATICKGLNKSRKGWELNEELAYTIGLGHDLGHAPFGHAGEKKLNALLGNHDTFVHEINGYRVVEFLANSGKGLNLTYAVKDGIICHCGEKFERSMTPRTNYLDLDTIKDRKVYPSTYEGCIARFADKIAYFGRDIEDAILAGLIDIDKIPRNLRKELGSKNGDIIDKLVNDLIQNSSKAGKLQFSEKKHELILQLSEFNYKYIYNDKEIKKWAEHGEFIIETIYSYLSKLYINNGLQFKKYANEKERIFDAAFRNYLNKMKKFYSKEQTPPARIIVDYISGMTDDYALKWMNYICIPQPIHMLMFDE